MHQHEVADRYFAAMRAQDVDALLAIFAEDGVLVWPDGRSINGHAAIRETYNTLFARSSNNPAPGPLMIGPGCFATEVHSRLPDGSERRTINVFHLRKDGLIARMSSYGQG